MKILDLDEQSAPKRFYRWVYRILTSQKVLITYELVGGRVHETLRFAKISKAQAIGMGFLRGKKIKDELAFAPFKIYVRFIPDNPPLTPYSTDPDGTVRENMETASTLYDHYRNDAVLKFLKGMTTKKVMTPIDQKKLLMIVGILAGAGLGLYMILT